MSLKLENSRPVQVETLEKQDLRSEFLAKVDRGDMLRELRGRPNLEQDLKFYQHLDKSLSDLRSLSGSSAHIRHTIGLPDDGKSAHIRHTIGLPDENLRDLFHSKGVITDQPKGPRFDITHDQFDNFLTDLKTLIGKYENMPKPPQNAPQRPNMEIEGGKVTIAPDGAITVIGGMVRIHGELPRPSTPFQGPNWREHTLPHIRDLDDHIRDIDPGFDLGRIKPPPFRGSWGGLEKPGPYIDYQGINEKLKEIIIDHLKEGRGSSPFERLLKFTHELC